MAIKEKPSHEDLILYEVLRHPVLCPEFIRNVDLDPEYDDEFEFSWYQKEILCDFNPKVSICTARATGKTVSLASMLLWILIFNIFPGDYALYTVPSKVHLEPVFTELVRMFRSNSFLKNFIEKNAGINSSDYKITTLLNTTLMCRIAGQSGTGANLIGLHTPFIAADECVTGTQRIHTDGSSRKLARNIKVGDPITSWNGKDIEVDRVSSVEKIKTDQKVLVIEFNGGKIHVGEKHRVYTDNGYIEAGKLSEGDVIYLNKFKGNDKYDDYSIDKIKELVLSGESLDSVANILGRTRGSIVHIIDKVFGGVRNLRDEPLSDEQIQIIMGTLLGDSSADIRYQNRANVYTNHSIKQRQYVDWLVDKLGYLVRARPRITRNGGWGTLNYSFGTLYHKQIKTISSSLYVNNKKTITKAFLDKLDKLGLAVWFMDDGSYSGQISTHGFSYDENVIISDYFRDRWGINSRVLKDSRKDLYYIDIIDKTSFRDLIRDYIPDCMKYKVDKNFSPPEIDLSNSIIPISETRENLSPTTITKISKIRTTPRFLYQITVEKNHNFFCNGVLVKNCGYFPMNAFQEMQPSENVWTPGHRMLVTGVPTGLRESNVLYMADQENPNYTKHRVSSYDNPRVTEEDIERAIIQYGGKDTDDFTHYVLGRHGKPVFSLFDRNLMKIETYPVVKLEIDGIRMGDNFDEIVTRISAFPAIKEKNYGVIMGIDLGYTEPTAIIIAYIDGKDQIKFHGRIRLSKVSYPIQERLIDLLDTRFEPMLIGMDEGNSGKNVRQHLIMDKEYSKKGFDKRIVQIDFSSWTVIGIDSDGSEIKTKTKPFTVSILQDYSNNHKIVYSTTDMDMVSELERMTYSKSVNGDITYKTLTDRGGKRGEDHFTSALLCGVGAYHITNGMNLSVERKKLFRPSWII